MKVQYIDILVVLNYFFSINDFKLISKLKIENWFSEMKSKLQKKEGLTYNNLKINIQTVIE